MPNPVITTTVRLNMKLHCGVEMLSAARGLSKNTILNAAVADYLARNVPPTPVGTPLAPAPGTPIPDTSQRRQKTRKLEVVG